MRNEDIIRAWKDEAYRASLTEAQLVQMPDHPIGMVELDDEDLVDAAAAGVPSFDPFCISVVISITVDISIGLTYLLDCP